MARIRGAPLLRCVRLLFASMASFAMLLLFYGVFVWNGDRNVNCIVQSRV